MENKNNVPKNGDGGLKKAAFVPLYTDIVPAVIARCGAAALGCFCVLARKADFGAGWTVSAGLRDMAAWCGLSVNTLKTKILAPLEEAGFIRVDSPDRQKTLVTLSIMNDVESGKSVSNLDTDEKNFYKKNKSVSKLDTDNNGFAALFPQFVVKMGEKTTRFPTETLGNDKGTVSNFDTEAVQSEKTVSNSDTAKTVSNFDTAAPSPHLSPIEVINNNININTAKPETKKNNFLPSLADVKAYFAEKNYITDPEEFFNKNEARGWTWCDRAGKTHKIRNWKATAYEFEKRTKAAGRVNLKNPQTTEEKLFSWYYQNVLPELFANETALAERWAREKGSFAFIATVAKDLQRGKDIIQTATETLEKGGFPASLKAIANMALTVNDKLGVLK